MNTGFLGPAVATVLTVYGIETRLNASLSTDLTNTSLQQYLPFTVLKPSDASVTITNSPALQQYLPFTVLKLITLRFDGVAVISVATVLTVYGIETLHC